MFVAQAFRTASETFSAAPNGATTLLSVQTIGNSATPLLRAQPVAPGSVRVPAVHAAAYGGGTPALQRIKV